MVEGHTTEIYCRQFSFSTKLFPRPIYFQTRIESVLPRFKRIIEHEPGVVHLRSLMHSINEIENHCNTNNHVTYITLCSTDEHSLYCANIFVKCPSKDPWKGIKAPSVCRLQQAQFSNDPSHAFVIAIQSCSEQKLAYTVKKISDTIPHYLKSNITVLVQSKSQVKDKREFCAKVKSIVDTNMKCDFDTETQLVFEDSLDHVSWQQEKFGESSKSKHIDKMKNTIKFHMMNFSDNDSRIQELDATYMKRVELFRSLSALEPKTNGAIGPSSQKFNTWAGHKQDWNYKILKSQMRIDEPCSTVSLIGFANQGQSFTSPYCLDVDSRQRKNMLQCETFNKQMVVDNTNVMRSSYYDSALTLKNAISLQLENKLFVVIERILTLLQSVKQTRNNNNEKQALTLVDKLLFEVKGLCGQFETKKATVMKTKTYTPRLSSELQKKILGIKSVLGCGTVFNKLTINIQLENAAEREIITQKIKGLLEQHHYKPDFIVNIITRT